MTLGATRFSAWKHGLLAAALLLVPLQVLAHGVAEGDRLFIENNAGLQLVPFVYLGAKHMVTGYDHLLFLLGVIFLLRQWRDVGVYVSLFAIGHSITLLAGVLGQWQVNAYLIDAVIGLSVVYKALDNLGGFQAVGWRPEPRAAVFIFGLIHGLGLATKLQEFHLADEGLVANIIAFNVGVEFGQLLALGGMLILMALWQRAAGFARHAVIANGALMAAGFLLTFHQLAGYALS